MFASVISIIIVLGGLLAMRILPISQYPEIIPPEVSVTATYPGASAETIASTVAALLCFFSHISAFGIYALIVTSIEVQPAFAEWRAGDWRALRHRIGIAAAQFLLPIIIALMSWRPGIGGKIVYWEFSYKIT